MLYYQLCRQLCSRSGGWSCLRFHGVTPGQNDPSVFLACRMTTNATSPSAILPHGSVEPPRTPKYPCPFISEADIAKYLLPLYSTGWGISHVPPESCSPIPSATQLSKRMYFPSDDTAEVVTRDIKSQVIKPENHHPNWTFEKSAPAGSYVTIHVHTHSAIAPKGRCNLNDEGNVSNRRPGITYRDIRFALLVDGLLQDYMYHQTLFEMTPCFDFPQPKNIDHVHNFQPAGQTE